MKAGIPPGTRFGPYEIAGWLGAGGMGEVYRARDTRLERDVAIKLIAAAAANPDRVQRFEREARAAAQLSHPAILAVHDIAVHDGVPYIVSELLEGESLRARLNGGALPLRKAVDIARQVADGLAAAHDRGIVHRDIKPENLFITSDGRVKILDFGIAKLLGGTDGGHRGVTETAEGLVVGTAAYMAPEQVRGETVDARADIFSLGVVLHEMLSGRAPFARETSAETMTAILNAEPPDLEPAGVPDRIARVVSRCLEKSRATRFQSARDLAFGLEMLTGTQPSAVVQAPVSRFGWVAAAVVLGVATIGLAWFVTAAARRGAPIDPLAEASYSRLTNWPGNEEAAAISPDGRFVAFLSDRDGEYDVWIGQIGTGTFVNLTRSVPPLVPPGRVLSSLGFTGDGAHLWLSNEDGDGARRQFLIPVGGGELRPFLGSGDLSPSWSPDGTRVVYFNNRDGDPLYVGGPMGADARTVFEDPKGLHNHNPAWSVDANWIYFVHGGDINAQMNVWRVRPDGSGREQLTSQESAANSIATLDARTLLYTARASDLSGPWLWTVDVTTKLARRVRAGLERYTSVSASRDGSRIVASIANPVSTLWRTPILEQSIDSSRVEPYSLPVDTAFGPRFAGSSLYFISERGAGNGLWRVDEAGQLSQVWNALDGTLMEPPAITRDGARIALVLRDGSRRRIVAIARDGTNPRTLSAGIDVRGTPNQSLADWSPDGQWIAVGGDDGNGPGLFKIPVAGGAPVRLHSGHAEHPVWSPDGSFILFSRELVTGRVEVGAVRADGTPMKLPVPLRSGAGTYRFTPDGTRIVYMPFHAAANLHIYDLGTGSSRPLFVANNRGRLNSFDVTADGRHVVFDLTVEHSDVLLIDLPKHAAR